MRKEILNLIKILFLILFVVLSLNKITSAQTTTSTTPSTDNSKPDISSLSPEMQSLFNQSWSMITQGSGGVDNNTNLPIGFEEQISINLYPSFPKPNQEVQIYLESYSTDLDKATITWTRDGKTILKGLGAKQIIIDAPETNKSSRIVAFISKSDGGNLTREITLSPSQVEIIYEPLTYVPPFYKGRSLFTSQSAIKFVAIPSFFNNLGQRYNSNDLIYQWTINGAVISGSSGAGKNIFYYQSPLIQRDMIVGVNVSSPNSVSKAKDEVFIDMFQPQILLYEDNPMYGTLFEKVISGNFSLEREEVKLAAMPYFFNINSRNNLDIDYKWFMNGKNLDVGTKENFLILRNVEKISGSSEVRLDTSLTENILQNSKTAVRIDYTNATSSLENFNF